MSVMLVLAAALNAAMCGFNIAYGWREANEHQPCRKEMIEVSLCGLASIWCMGAAIRRFRVRS